MCNITNLTGTSGGGKVTKMPLVASYYSGACHVPIYDGIHADISGRTSFLCGQSLPCQSEFLRRHLLQPCRQPIQRIQQASSSEFQPKQCKAKTRNSLSVIYFVHAFLALIKTRLTGLQWCSWSRAPGSLKAQVSF